MRTDLSYQWVVVEESCPEVFDDLTALMKKNLGVVQQHFTGMSYAPKRLNMRFSLA